MVKDFDNLPFKYAAFLLSRVVDAQGEALLVWGLDRNNRFASESRFEERIFEYLNCLVS